MNNNVACIFNIAALYRESIYKLIDKEIKCSFYIGDRTWSYMKLMDYNSLFGFESMLSFKKCFWRFYILKGLSYSVLNKYSTFILTGDPFCLTYWKILILSRLMGKKSILWCHGWYGNESGLKKYLKLIFYKLSSYTMVYSDYAKNLMINNGIPDRKIKCIYNSLAYDEQLRVRNKLKVTNIYREHFGNNNQVLLYIGRIQKVKKLYQVIDAMSILRSRGLYLNFVCIGQDIDNVNLLEYAKSKNISDTIWMYGPLFDESKKGQLMYNADICVSPGNVGLTSVDSLTFGLPVITHNNFPEQMPEFEAIQDGVSGAFFAENDTEDFANKIESWLCQAKNKNRQDIAATCQKIIDERYNPHYQIEVIKSIL